MSVKVYEYCSYMKSDSLEAVICFHPFVPWLQALAFAVLVAACVAISDVSVDTEGADDNVVALVEDSRSATGFLIFVSLVVLLWELGLVILRFLNFGAINRFFTIFALVVSVQIRSLLSISIIHTTLPPRE